MEAERYGYDDANRAADFFREGLIQRGMDPDAVNDGVILGSGLGDFDVRHLGASESVSDGPSSPLVSSFNDVFEHLELPPSKGGVKGHAKRLVIAPGSSEKELIMAQSGREHLYEGVDIKRAVFWIRVMQLLGVKTLIGSNASGIVTPHTLEPGNIVSVMEDVDDTDDNPLKGENDPRFGIRFPHRADYYPKHVRDLMRKLSPQFGLTLKDGVYFRKPGPGYETPGMVYDMREKLRGMYRQGAVQIGDQERWQKNHGRPVGVVGMSSTYERLVARHAELSTSHPAFTEGVGYLSVGTNYSASLGPNGIVIPSNHEEVTESAGSVQGRMGDLVKAAIMEFQSRRKAA